MPEVVYPESALKAFLGEGHLATALHSAVANQSVQGRQFIRVQATAEFSGELSHHLERSQVQTHRFHLRRGAFSLCFLPQTFAGLPGAAWNAASDDDVRGGRGSRIAN